MLKWLQKIIYRDMAIMTAITDPRIKDRLHCTYEAAPVYSAGLELLAVSLAVLLVCEAPRPKEVVSESETPVARAAPDRI